MANYLVKLEYVCERNALERSLLAQNQLFFPLALLSGQLSKVITLLSRKEFERYGEFKEVLLRRYKLSSEAFRQRLQYARKWNE